MHLYAQFLNNLELEQQNNPQLLPHSNNRAAPHRNPQSPPSLQDDTCTTVDRRESNISNISMSSNSPHATSTRRTVSAGSGSSAIDPQQQEQTSNEKMDWRFSIIPSKT